MKDMEERIEQFEHEGKRFIYFDLGGFRNNRQFMDLVNLAKKIIAEYPPDASALSITNIEGVIYDTETKNIVSAWMEFNKPYIRQGAVIGLDGIKRIMVNSILKMSGRTNIKFLRTKEEAVTWLSAL